MNTYSIPEKFLDAFKVPRKYKYLAWLITLFIVAIGIYISILLKDWLWLARTGAIIVVVSLALEASGFLDRYIGKVMKIVSEIAPQIVSMQVSNRPHMYGLNGSETEEQLKQIAMKETARRLKDVSSVIEQRATKNLHKTVFAIATLGTLLWGFADLLELIWSLNSK